MRTLLLAVALAGTVQAGHPVALSDPSWPNLAATPNPLLSGLIHAWQLNEGAGSISVDHVGGKDLLLHNAPTWSTNAGLAGITFASASSQYLDSGTWQVGTSNGFSLAVWFFYTNTPSDMMLVTKESVNETWQVFVTGGLLSLFVTDCTDSGAWQDTPPPTNTWHQAVITFGAGVIQEGFVDGTDFGTFGGAFGSVCDRNTTLQVGRYAAFGGGFYYSGTMGPIYVWNRALTTNEVSQLYTNRYLFP